MKVSTKSRTEFLSPQEIEGIGYDSPFNNEESHFSLAIFIKNTYNLHTMMQNTSLGENQ